MIKAPIGEKLKDRIVISLPGSKSITNWVLLMAALSNQSVKFINVGTGKDCKIMLDCLKQLGVDIIQNGTEVEIKGMNGKLGI